MRVMNRFRVAEGLGNRRQGLILSRMASDPLPDTRMSETAAPAAPTFIRVTEIWVPDRTRSRLELHDGAYGELDVFRNFSEAVTFDYGEGLPGTAWQSGRPVVLRYLDGSVFKRTIEAGEAGLTSAVAFPIFSGEFLRAVLVFLCGDTRDLSGAIEIWSDPDSGVLELEDGFYGDLKKFESLSRSLQFPRGTGLPGMVWRDARPHLLADVTASSSFLRSRYAAEVGIRAGVGIPFFDAGELRTVVTFLSSKSTPIARRFEVWCPDESRACLRFEAGIDENSDEVEPADPERRIERGEGTIGLSWLRGIPEVAEGAEVGDYRSLLAIPIIDGGLLNSVIVCYV